MRFKISTWWRLNANRTPMQVVPPTMHSSRFVSRLALGILTLNLVVAALLALTLYESHKHFVREAEIAVQNLASSLAQSIASDFDKIDHAITAVVDETARQIDYGGLSATEMGVFITRQTERLVGLDDIRVFDADGNLQFATGVGPGAFANIADREYFLRARDDTRPQLIFSGVLTSRINNRRVLVLARRLNNLDGSFTGIVLAPLYLDKLERRMAAVDSGRDGMVVLRDEQLKVITRYPTTVQGNATLGNQVMTPELAEQIRINPARGVYRVRSPVDQIERTLAYSAIDGYPFSVVVGLSDEHYLEQWRSSVIQHGLMLLVFLFATLGFGWLTARTWLRLVRNEQRFRTLLKSSPYPLVIVDDKGLITLVNERAVSLFGYELHELTGRPVEVLMPERYRAGHGALRQSFPQTPRGREMSESPILWALTKDGREIPVNISLNPIQTDQGPMVAAAIVDISERLKANEQIEFLAFHDALTELPNRRLLLERLEHARAASARTQCHAALLLLDLDDFKTLNDTLGHDQGDRLLQEVARRLVQGVRADDSVARLGGDEFMVLFEGLSGQAESAATQVETLAEKILSSLGQPYLLDGYVIRSTPSIGATLISGTQTSVEELMKQADLAMYQSKKAGRNTLRFFDPQMQALVTHHAELEAQLRNALTQHQFILHYQAQVKNEHEITGVEALVRWCHPERGLIGPAEFIPLAEETGLILPLGQWVLNAACSQLAHWATRPEFAHLTIAVNVSARQFRQDDFANQVLAVLKRTQANPNRLKLELTESLLLADVDEVIAKMHTLKDAGVTFSLDDFGTGYSSLSYLKRLPLTQLKIDQGFVRNVLHDANDAAIARMVIALADTMGLDVIAEGVEIEAQRCFLADLGCDHCQGYLFSHPLASKKFEALVTRV